LSKFAIFSVTIMWFSALLTMLAKALITVAIIAGGTKSKQRNWL